MFTSLVLTDDVITEVKFNFGKAATQGATSRYISHLTNAIAYQVKD